MIRTKSVVLPYGLLGKGLMQDGRIFEIDGQHVSKFNGINIIDDTRSPYDGMSLEDYQKLSFTWKKEVCIIKNGMRVIITKSIPKNELPEYPKNIKNYKYGTD